MCYNWKAIEKILQYVKRPADWQAFLLFCLVYFVDTILFDFFPQLSCPRRPLGVFLSVGEIFLVFPG